MHSSRTRTASLLIVSRSIRRRGVPPGCGTPLVMWPVMHAGKSTPLEADLPDVDPPGWRLPCHVTCDACWEANHLPGQNELHTALITLPQASFASGNKLKLYATRNEFKLSLSLFSGCFYVNESKGQHKFQVNL